MLLVTVRFLLLPVVIVTVAIGIVARNVDDRAGSGGIVGRSRVIREIDVGSTNTGNDISLLVCMPHSICIGPALTVVGRVPDTVGISPASSVLSVLGILVVLVPHTVGVSPTTLVVLIALVPLPVGISPAILIVVLIMGPVASMDASTRDFNLGKTNTRGSKVAVFAKLLGAQRLRRDRATLPVVVGLAILVPIIVPFPVVSAPLAIFIVAILTILVVLAILIPANLVVTLMGMKLPFKSL